MNIKEFRILLNSRVEILKKIKLKTSNKDLLALEKELKEIDVKIAPNSDNVEMNLRKICSVSEEILSEKLVKFLKTNIEYNEDKLQHFMGRVYVKINNKLYVLWDKSDFTSNNNLVDLKFLYSDKNNYSWEEIISDFPQIEDCLWQSIVENFNKNKFEKVGLISRIIKEKQEELKRLTNPEYIKNKVANLRSEISKNQEELLEIQPTLEQIEI